jgi:hypothetical protein
MQPHIHGRDFRPSEVPFSQLTSRLSPAAESGDVARGIGFMPARQHQAPRRPVSSKSVLFVWPESSRHHPHQNDRGLRA